VKDFTRLDRLLSLRRQEELRRAADLQEALRVLNEASDGVSSLEAQRAEIEGLSAVTEEQSVWHMKTLLLLVERVDRELQSARAALISAEQFVSSKREELASALQDSDALEKVIEPRRAAAEQHDRRIEQKQEDAQASLGTVDFRGAE
jgi:flagellar export protein FliJ